MGIPTDFYADNPAALQQLLPQSTEGQDMIKLSFFFNFYFPEGYLKEQRQRVFDVCTSYWKLAGSNMRWMVKPMKYHWKMIDTENNLESWATAFPDDDYVWSLIFHSGQSRHDPGEFEILGLGSTAKVHSPSNLHLTFPVTWFSNAAHPTPHPATLFKHWASILQPRFGTAGFGLTPPEDTPRRGETDAVAAAFGRAFPGVEMVDQIGNLNALHGMLAINWLTVINDAALSELGGIEALRHAVGESVFIEPYSGGALFQSGEQPALCEGSQTGHAPLAYRPLAHALRPLRTTEPWGCWGCPKDESLDWLARFD